MKTNKQIALGKKTALLSFLIGTIILVAFYFSDKTELIFVGLLYILIAIIFNIVVFILLTPDRKSSDLEKRKLIRVRLLMLFNIPVTFVYFWFALGLLNNLRITFENTTQDPLSNIEILGCENLTIPNLKPNQSKTVWIEITGDCSVDIIYDQNGVRKNASVIEYSSFGNGQKLKYKISQENHSLF